MSVILLLEDDLNLSETIEEFLVENGFEIDCVYDGEAAEEKIYEKSYDLLLLDVNVPRLNGFELLRSSRQEGKTTPAIFMTSRDSIDDVTEGFESGGDDYIRKPFALKELLLRINAIVKRDFFHNENEKVDLGEGLSFDLRGDVLLRDGVEQSLNNKEKKLLKFFLKHQKEQVSHEMINEALWGFDETSSDLALRTYIKNLRKVLGKDRIVSIKRYGYKFA